MSQALEIADVTTMRRELIREITIALGFSRSGWSRRLAAPLVWLPAHRFATLAAKFDRIAALEGLPAACRWLLSVLVQSVRSEGAEVIPREGPLVVVSNHPGVMDGLAIVSNLPRNDTRVVATGIPFFRAFRAARHHLLYIPREGMGRSTAVREMLRHLEGGGSLMLFPSGNIDPDPAVLPGAAEALSNWSSSVDLILRRMPEVQVLVTIVSDVISPKWFGHPLVRRQTIARERQKVAEFLQTMQQLVLGKTLSFTPRVTFSSPVTAADLRSAAGFLPQLIERAQRLLREHLSSRAEE